MTEQKAVGKISPPWSVYLIRTAANQLYCGVTTDVTRRFLEHQSKSQGAKFLKGKGPLTLAWSQAIGDKRVAMQVEYRIKQLPKKKKEQLVAGDYSVAEWIEGQA
ncbi:GIY-YIG nuclease family protein [Photobacterium japonica]|uniref:GIY-YIG nuclease family protein n=1 Tax=Photobacterium japonica TaxID=2910235 RepID=UPI003D0E02BE